MRDVLFVIFPTAGSMPYLISCFIYQLLILVEKKTVVMLTLSLLFLPVS
jgi:hypothetical protein